MDYLMNQGNTHIIKWFNKHLRENLISQGNHQTAVNRVLLLLTILNLIICNL